MLGRGCCCCGYSEISGGQNGRHFRAGRRDGNGLDGGTGKEAEGFLTMVPSLPELGGREVGGSKRSQGRDFTPERSSAHIVGFRPLPQTSRAVRTGVMPLTMVLPELGGREVGVSKRSQGRDFTPERRSAHIVGFRPPPRTSRAVRTGVMPLTIDQPKVGVNRGQRCRFSAAAAHAISSCVAAQAQPDAVHRRATYHLIPSGAAA